MTQDRGLVPAQIRQTDISELSAEEVVLIQGDLSVLTAKQRVDYYGAVCKSVGLNPLTKPFDYINLNGKLTLYAKKDCTDQLRDIHSIDITQLERSNVGGIFMVTAYGRNGKGRTDSSIGAVPIENLRGESLANAMMKAETKAKRRLTLSLAGLGWLDENEVATAPTAQQVQVNDDGEIVQPTPLQTQRPRTLAEAVQRPPAEPAPVAPVAPGKPAEPAAAPEPAPVVESAPEVTEADYKEMAETLAPDAVDTPPMVGITWPELRKLMREKYIPSALISKTARRMFGEEAGSDLTALSNEQRLELLNEVLSIQDASKQEG